MKKVCIICIMLSLIMICSFPVSAIAETDSKTAEEKFNEYINTLSEEYAALILSDDEVVSMMKSDYYWENKKSDFSTQNTYNKLPVPGYPSGSYYTISGKACTTCHSGEGCDYIFPTGWSGEIDRCYIPDTGKSGNCKIYKGTNSMQCKGFADYIYCLYNEEDVSDRTKVDMSAYISIPYSTTDSDKAEEGAELMKECFSSLPVGSNIRVIYRSTGGKHSIIISSKSSTGITVYDANSDGLTCIVKNQFFTWEQLAKKYKSITMAWRGL